MSFSRIKSVFQHYDQWITMEPIDGYPVDMFIWKHTGDQEPNHISVELILAATTPSGRNNLMLRRKLRLQRDNWENNIRTDVQVLLLHERLGAHLRQQCSYESQKNEHVQFVPNEEMPIWFYPPMPEPMFSPPMYSWYFGQVDNKKCKLFVFENPSMATAGSHRHLDIVLCVETELSVGGLMGRIKLAVPRKSWRQHLFNSRQLRRLRRRIALHGLRDTELYQANEQEIKH